MFRTVSYPIAYGRIRFYTVAYGRIFCFPALTNIFPVLLASALVFFGITLERLPEKRKSHLCHGIRYAHLFTRVELEHSIPELAFLLQAQGCRRCVHIDVHEETFLYFGRHIGYPFLIGCFLVNLSSSPVVAATGLFLCPQPAALI